MITITLSETDAKHLDTVQALADGARLTDPNLNGANIRVRVGDHTSVGGCDELVGASLLAQVLAVVSGES